MVVFTGKKNRRNVIDDNHTSVRLWTALAVGLGCLAGCAAAWGSWIAPAIMALGIVVIVATANLFRNLYKQSEAVTTHIAHLPLVLWLATIGADRIDLLAGRGSFLLTPFLILSPLIIFAVFPRFVISRPGWSMRLPKNAGMLTMLLNLLLVMVLASIIAGYDAQLELKRFFLLAAQIYFALIIATIIYNTADPKRILAHGAYAGVTLASVFAVVQLCVWLSPSLQPALNFGIVDLTPGTISSWAPRLATVSADPNRGGALLLIYFFLILKFAKPTAWRTWFLWLTVVLIVLTLSRSAIAGLMVAGLIMLYQTGRLHPRMLLKKAVIVLLLMVAAGYMIGYSEIESAIDFQRLIGERASLATYESGGIHLAVIERGIVVAVSSAKNFLLGVGFGSGYSVLRDFYPGYKYGNFHSMYVTFLAEVGFGALLLFLLLCCLPLLKSREYLPLAVGLMVFNVFYQMVLEPLFWFYIVLLWTNIGLERTSHNSSPGLQHSRDGVA